MPIIGWKPIPQKPLENVDDKKVLYLNGDHLQCTCYWSQSSL